MRASSRSSMAVVGPGAIGTSIAVALHEAGAHRCSAVAHDVST